MRRRSSAVAEPRSGLASLGVWPEALMKSAACTCSSADWLVTSEPTIRMVVLTKRLQKTACASGSSHSSPNSACGRSHERPYGPSAMIAATVEDEEAKDGMKLAHIQIRKPADMAAMAALAEASRQKSAASIAGRNCATPVKDIRPIGASALDMRVR